MPVWSPFQDKIFAWTESPSKKHLMVKAGAGCGKTTTIVELFRRIVAKEPSANVQFLAFNKKIADELKSRDVPAGTLNSFGFRQVCKAFPRIKLDADKVRKLCKDYGVEYRQMGIVQKTVSLMKAYLAPLNESDEVLRFHARGIQYDFNLCEGVMPEPFLQKIVEIFRASLKDFNTIDFDDQICYPVYHDLPATKCDYIIVDESQDLAPAKLEMVARSVGKHFVCVGDPLQAIYGFAGADSSSMDKIEARFKPHVMTLPVTYRCGKSIVAETHRLKVAPSDFQAGESNREGEVRSVKEMVFVREVKPTDFVLCRANAPLVTCCFNLIKRGIRAMIIGRDIGAKLIGLADKINGKGPATTEQNEVVQFAAKMREYEELECKKLLAQQKEAAAEALSDQIDCLSVFLENAKTFAEMKAKIQTMFDDSVNPDAVIHSTIHKAKGLEADVVWALPVKASKKTKNDKQAQEERNLLYVQITRAKNQFNWVTE